jgi:hypothetical protein
MKREINELKMKIRGGDQRYGKTSEKRIKKIHKTQWKAIPAD